MRQLLFIIILILAASLSYGNKTILYLNKCYNLSDTSIKESIFPTKNKDKIEKIVADIGRYETVDAAIVGFSGTKSAQYKRFEKLLWGATDSQLMKLTDNFNSNVKAYSFWALAIKKYPAIKTILEKHLNDRQTFQYLNGCVGSTKKINEWFLELAKDILTGEEIKKYSSMILK